MQVVGEPNFVPRRPQTAELPPVVPLWAGGGGRRDLSIVGRPAQAATGDLLQALDPPSASALLQRYRPSGRHALQPLQPPVHPGGDLQGTLAVAQHPSVPSSDVPRVQRPPCSAPPAAAPANRQATATSGGSSARLELEGDPYVLDPLLWPTVLSAEEKKVNREEREELWNRFAHRPLSEATKEAYEELYPGLHKAPEVCGGDGLQRMMGIGSII